MEISNPGKTIHQKAHFVLVIPEGDAFDSPVRQDAL
jgi:hypothetical protein